MPVRVGNTDIATVGKVKLGTTNITKIFRGSTQIWPSVIVYSFTSKMITSANGAGACSLAGTTDGSVYYSNVDYPIVGTIIYTNNTLTTPLNGGNLWWLFNDGLGGGGISHQINASGVVTTIFNCGF